MRKAKIIESVTIVLPLPDKKLSPNRPTGSRGSRMAKARITKRYRQTAWAIALNERVATGPWKRAQATLVFYWPDRRRRDIRNAEAAMKAAYDGIVDAGILADDSYDVLTHKPTQFKLDREHPRVEILIQRLAENNII